VQLRLLLLLYRGFKNICKTTQNFYFVSAIIAACHGYPYGCLCSNESGVSQSALLGEGGRRSYKASRARCWRNRCARRDAQPARPRAHPEPRLRRVRLRKGAAPTFAFHREMAVMEGRVLRLRV